MYINKIPQKKYTYDRPGRRAKRYIKYRRNKTHLGKGKTLRSYRRGSKKLVKYSVVRLFCPTLTDGDRLSAQYGEFVEGMYNV